MSRLIVCGWCGCAIEPNGPRMRLFASRSIKAIGRWIMHFHPSCGEDLIQFITTQRDQTALPPPFGDPGLWQSPPADREPPDEPG